MDGPIKCSSLTLVCEEHLERIFMIYEHSIHLCKCIVRYGYFTLLKFKGNLSKIIAKNLLNINAFSKRKCVSPLGALNWQCCIYFFNKSMTQKAVVICHVFRLSLAHTSCNITCESHHVFLSWSLDYYL
jgi:hypothetical protein